MAILATLVGAVSDRRSAVGTPPLQPADLKVGAAFPAAGGKSSRSFPKFAGQVTKGGHCVRLKYTRISIDVIEIVSYRWESANQGSFI
jgi:hypothetical protein